MIHFVFNRQSLLLQLLDNGKFAVPESTHPPMALEPDTHVMEVLSNNGNEHVHAYSVQTDVAPQGFEFCTLRSCYGRISEADYLLAGKCEELLYWDAHTRFCGICGAPMAMHTLISKRCTQCGEEVWPQVSPAVIVLISKGEEMLLVHARNFRSGFYGLVAGFVETGESLEDAVKREVKEETGLEISNLQYFSSQPWPYPCGLMVGFTATYAGGEIQLQDEELSAGGWFSPNDLPTLPEKLSIARKLIDHHLAQLQAGSGQDVGHLRL